MYRFTSRGALVVAVSAALISVSVFSSQRAREVTRKPSSAEVVLRNIEVATDQKIEYMFPDRKPRYVEQIVVLAEGRQRAFSFAQVFADGELVGRLGVPGYDPAYPIMIRGEVSQIEIRPESNSRILVHSLSIDTERRSYSNYSKRPASDRKKYDNEMWGQETLSIANEIMRLNSDRAIAINYMAPLRKAAFNIQAKANVHDEKSMRILDEAKQLLAAISKAEELFDSSTYFLLDTRFDVLALDLKTIKADIIAKYNLK